MRYGPRSHADMRCIRTGAGQPAVNDQGDPESRNYMARTLTQDDGVPTQEQFRDEAVLVHLPADEERSGQMTSEAMRPRRRCCSSAWKDAALQTAKRVPPHGSDCASADGAERLR